MTKAATTKTPRKRTPSKRSSAGPTASVFDDRYFYPLFMLANPTAAGINVNERTAKKFSALFACVKIISEDLAKVSLSLYGQLEPRGKEKVREHWAAKILRRPNPWMTSFTFRQYMVGNMLTTGNAYAEKQYGRLGTPEQLIPLHPSDVQVKWLDGTGVYYVVTDPITFQKRIVLRKDMLHIIGHTENGLVGVNPVTLLKEGIGLGLAAEAFGAGFFGNGAAPASIIEYDKPVDPKQIEVLKEKIDKLYKGASKAGKTAILDSGMKWKPIGVNGKDAQYIELRRLQVEEIARPYRVPLYKLQDHTHSTFSNVESLNIEYANDCLSPWAARIEEALLCDLLNSDPDTTIDDFSDELYFRHSLRDLMRGDMASQNSYYSTGRQWGYLSSNDVREDLDLNPIGEQGDTYIVPANMMDLENVTKAEPRTPGPAVPEKDVKDGNVDEDAAPAAKNPPAAEEQKAKQLGILKEQFRGMFQSVWERVIRKEVSSVARAWKNKPAFEEWLAEFRDDHRAFARECVSDVVLPYCVILERNFGLAGDAQAFFEGILDEYVAGIESPKPEPTPRTNSTFWADRVLCYPSLAA